MLRWLEQLRSRRPPLSEEQQARIRRRSNVLAGIELILLGLALPFGYLITSLMMFSDPGALGLGLSIAGGVILVGLGAGAIWKHRR